MNHRNCDIDFSIYFNIEIYRNNIAIAGNKKESGKAK